MKIYYVVCIWIFLAEISSTDEIKMHGFSGKYVIISCDFNQASTNRKYFCRYPCKNNDDVVVSSDRSPNGRFRLEDFGNRAFKVTITDLQESDSGIYWCGVDRTAALDKYIKVYLNVYKGITPTSTTLNTTQPFSTATPKPETPFATSSRTSIYSKPDDITTSSSMTVAVNISLYAFGGLITVIILFCVLVAVHQYRKRVKTSADLAPVTSVKHNNCTVQEDDNIYENDLQGTPNSKQIQSKKLNPKVPKSNKLLVYENLTLNNGQADDIYQNP